MIRTRVFRFIRQAKRMHVRSDVCMIDPTSVIVIPDQEM
jgi:hypothetical protein